MTDVEKITRINEVVAALIETAKSNLERCAREGHDFAHVAFPIQFNGDRLGFDILHLSGESEDRHREVAEIHANLEHNNCEALVIINDAYATLVPADMTPADALAQGRAGTIPRKEALVTLVVGKNMPARTITNVYVRDGKAIRWEPQEECADFDSWMVPPQWRHTISKGVA